MKKKILGVLLLILTFSLFSCDLKLNNSDKVNDDIEEKQSYTLAYDSNGGSDVKSSSYEYEVIPTKPDDPTKPGYSFEGWFFDNNEFSNEYTYSYGFTENITLYAKWRLITYKITYNLDGGTNNSLNPTSYNVNSAEIELASPVKEGYSFVGWYKDNQFNELISKIPNGSTTNFTLFAKFTRAAVYTITVNTGINTSTLTTNSLGKLTLNNPERENYLFDGWYLEASYGTKIDLNTYLFTNNKAIYAKWISTDNTLLSITVNDEVFTINKDVTSYTYEVINNRSIVLSAVASSDKATITGLGSFILEGEGNSYTITVTSEAGATKTYQMIVSYIEVSTSDFISLTSNNEAIGIEWADLSTNVKVEYKLTTDNDYETLNTSLIRYSNGKARADILGLIPGTYDIKVTKANGDILTSSNILVSAIDRSGYAHFSTSANAIGAYNEDGSLKSTADIIYVSNSTKNTVTYKVGSTTYTGLVEILKNASKFTKPVVIRVLDSIKTNQWNIKSDAPRLADGTNYNTTALKDAFATNTLETTYGENLVGLVSNVTVVGYKRFKYVSTKTGVTLKTESNTSSSTTTYSRTEYSTITGKKVFDDDSYFNMIDISQTTKGLTIEGVGTEAEFYQFGMTFSKSSNVEINNLTFTGYPEDACSFEGSAGSEATYVGTFIHNVTFNRGVNNWDVSGERDKYAGDGATDLKRISGITISNCIYNNCKKTGLVGGSNSDLTYNITFHHNYYKNVESRLPLGRQANIHIYNNYYDGCNSTIDLRAHAYVFMEGNYFNNSRLPKASNNTDSGIKSYNDYYDANCLSITGDYTGPTVVSSRLATVSNACIVKNVSYSTFDTSSILFYYNSTKNSSDVTLLTNAVDAKAYCLAYSGVLKTNY